MADNPVTKLAEQMKNTLASVLDKVGSTFLNISTPQKPQPKQDIRHNPDLDAFFGESTPSNTFHGGNSQGAGGPGLADLVHIATAILGKMSISFPNAPQDNQGGGSSPPPNQGPSLNTVLNNLIGKNNTTIAPNPGGGAGGNQGGSNNPNQPASQGPCDPCEYLKELPKISSGIFELLTTTNAILGKMGGATATGGSGSQAQPTGSTKKPSWEDWFTHPIDSLVKRFPKTEKAVKGVEQIAGGGDPKFGDMFSGVSNIVGSVGEFVPGPAGKAIQFAGKLGDALGQSIEKLRKWNDVLHEGNMRFADFSGAMAAVAAKQAIRDVQLNIERGDRLARSADYLAEQKSQMERNLSQPEDITKRGLNYLGGLLAQGFNSVWEKMGPKKGWDALDDLLTKLEELFGDPDEISMSDFNEQMDKEPWFSDYGRPNRFD